MSDLAEQLRKSADISAAFNHIDYPDGKTLVSLVPLQARAVNDQTIFQNLNSLESRAAQQFHVAHQELIGKSKSSVATLFDFPENVRPACE